MTKIISAFILLFLFLECINQNEDKNRQTENILFCENCDTTYFTGQENMFSVRIYDKESNELEEEKLFSSNKNIIYTTIYTYNEKGKRIKEERLSPSGDLMFETNYKYDEKGYRVEESETNGEKTFIHSRWKYDNNGNKIECTEYYLNSIVKKTIYDYDDEENLVKESEFDSKDSLQNMTTYIYDMQGSLISFHYNFPHGITGEATKRRYNDLGILIEEVQLKSTDGSNYFWTEKTIYEYNIIRDKIDSIQIWPKIN